MPWLVATYRSRRLGCQVAEFSAPVTKVAALGHFDLPQTCRENRSPYRVGGEWMAPAG